MLMFALLASTQSIAEELVPLERWATTLPKWTEDISEVAYATTRCGTLFMVIGGVFIQNAAKDEDIQNGKDVGDRGLELTLFGNLLSETIGSSKENQLARSSLLLKSYAERIARNRRLHNNMFHGHIQSDYKFCLILEAQQRELKERNGTEKNQIDRKR